LKAELTFYGLEHVIKLVNIDVEAQKRNREGMDGSNRILNEKSSELKLHPKKPKIMPRFDFDYMRDVKLPSFISFHAREVENFIMTFTAVNLIFTPIFMSMWHQGVIPYRLAFIPFNLAILPWMIFFGVHAFFSAWRTRRWTLAKVWIILKELMFVIYGSYWIVMQFTGFHAYIFEKEISGWGLFILAHTVPTMIGTGVWWDHYLDSRYQFVFNDLKILRCHHGLISILIIICMCLFALSPLVWSFEILSSLDPSWFSGLWHVYLFERITFWFTASFLLYVYALHEYIHYKDDKHLDYVALIIIHFMIGRGIIELSGWQGFISWNLLILLHAIWYVFQVQSTG
jgi:hypothetical protein